MNRISKYISISVLVLLNIICIDAKACTGWSDTENGGGSNMSCSQIIKKWDTQWFHYATEECPLKVEDVYDYDYYNDGDGFELRETDYHDHDNCTWKGSDLCDIHGHTAVWDPQDHTGESGVEIQFTMNDTASTPSPAYDGRNVDDERRYRYIQMYAYEAVAYLNCTSSNSGSPSTGPIYESTGTPDSNVISLTKNWKESEIGDGEDENKDPNSISSYGSATWRLAANPSTATLGSTGQLKTSIGVNASGKIFAEVRDQDVTEGDTTVNVGLVGGQGICAGVSVSWIIDDDSEAIVAGGFAFSSDDLGDDTDDEINIVSAPFPDIPAYFIGDANEPFSYNPENAEFRGGIDSTSKAKALVEAKTIVKGESYICPSTLARTRSWGGVTYSVGVPTYEPGTLTQNSNW